MKMACASCWKVRMSLSVSFGRKAETIAKQASSFWTASVALRLILYAKYHGKLLALIS